MNGVLVMYLADIAVDVNTAGDSTVPFDSTRP